MSHGETQDAGTGSASAATSTEIPGNHQQRSGGNTFYGDSTMFLSGIQWVSLRTGQMFTSDDLTNHDLLLAPVVTGRHSVFLLCTCRLWHSLCLYKILGISCEGHVYSAVAGRVLRMFAQRPSRLI